MYGYAMKTDPTQTPKGSTMNHVHVPSFWSKCDICGQSGVYAAVSEVRVLDHEVQVDGVSVQRCVRAVGLARCTAPAPSGDCGRHQ